MKQPHTQVKIAEAKPCDFCKQDGVERDAKYDGKTKMGPWANMCEMHFKHYGLGLGLGVGQELIVE
jgi:hypothetical protein